MCGVVVWLCIVIVNAGIFAGDQQQQHFFHRVIASHAEIEQVHRFVMWLFVIIIFILNHFTTTLSHSLLVKVNAAARIALTWITWRFLEPCRERKEKKISLWMRLLDRNTAERHSAFINIWDLSHRTCYLLRNQLVQITFLQLFERFWSCFSTFEKLIWFWTLTLMAKARGSHIWYAWEIRTQAMLLDWVHATVWSVTELKRWIAVPHTYRSLP